MKLSKYLAVLIGIFVVACSTATPAPNIDATVEARLTHERAVEATVQARLVEGKLIRERAVEATVESARG